MKKLIIAASAAALAFTGAAVSAQAPQGGQGQMRPTTQTEAIARADQRFQRLDTNRDRQLTQAELQAGKRNSGAKPGMRQGDGNEAKQHRQKRGRNHGGRVARIDTNRDGVITQAEFRAHAVERFAKRGSRPNGQR